MLVTFGGADPASLTEKTVRALASLPGEFEVQVILGLAYEPRGRCERIAALGPRFGARACADMNAASAAVW